MGFNCLRARATSRRQFTFYHLIPRNSWYSFYRQRRNETLGQPLSHKSNLHGSTENCKTIMVRNVDVLLIQLHCKRFWPSISLKRNNHYLRITAWKKRIKGQHHLRLYFLVDVVRCASLSVRLQNTFINNISGMNHRFFASKYPLREGESMWDYHFWFVEVRCSSYWIGLHDFLISNISGRNQLIP